jgi:2-dehydropantoate 2-reductase
MSDASSRYVIVGAGAIGGTAAALLHRAGHEVRVVARGAHGDAIRKQGITLRTPDGEETTRLDVVSAADLVIDRESDVVIMAVKSQDTAAALQQVVLAGGDGATVVCAQNGVANEPACARMTDRVVAAMIWSPAVFLSPGVIECYARPDPAMWLLGPWQGGRSEASERLARDLVGAGVSALARNDVLRFKYAKLLGNLGNAVDAIFDVDREDPQDDWPAVLSELRREGAACLRAAGIECASPGEMSDLLGSRVVDSTIDGLSRPGGSSWQSLRRGASLEIDYLNGEICLLGARYSVPTPLNRAVLRVAAEHLRQRRRPRSATRQDLGRALGSC